MCPVDVFKLLEAAGLAIEKLEHRHPRQVFLQVGVDACDGDANLAVRLAHGLAKHHGGEHNQGQNGKRQQG